MRSSSVERSRALPTPRRARVFVGDAAVTTYGVGDLARRNRSRGVRRATVELGEAEGDQWFDHIVDVAAAQHAEYTTSLPRHVEGPIESGDECLHAGGIVRAVDDDHWLARDELHTTRHASLGECRGDRLFTERATRKASAATMAVAAFTPWWMP